MVLNLFLLPHLPITAAVTSDWPLCPCEFSGWQDEVETLTPSPMIQRPPPTLTPPMARQRFRNFARESWDGGGGGAVGTPSSGGGGQVYQPSKYGLVVEEMYGRDNYSYQPPAGYDAGGYCYPAGGGSAGGGGGGGGGMFCWLFPSHFGLFLLAVCSCCALDLFCTESVCMVYNNTACKQERKKLEKLGGHDIYNIEKQR